MHPTTDMNKQIVPMSNTCSIKTLNKTSKIARIAFYFKRIM